MGLGSWIDQSSDQMIAVTDSYLLTAIIWLRQQRQRPFAVTVMVLRKRWIRNVLLGRGWYRRRTRNGDADVLSGREQESGLQPDFVQTNKQNELESEFGDLLSECSAKRLGHQAICQDTKACT